MSPESTPLKDPCTDSIFKEPNAFFKDRIEDFFLSNINGKKKKYVDNFEPCFQTNLRDIHAVSL